MRAAVVNLEPVAAVGRVCHPFVDAEVRDCAQTSGTVERTRSRHIERPRPGTIREAADGEIRGLQAVADRVNQAAAVGQSGEQEDRTPGGVQSEAGVVGGGRRVVVAIDQQETPGGDECAGREHKFPRSVRVVAEARVREVHRVGGRIEQLDPVRGGAVGVGQGMVAGENFVENDRHSDRCGGDGVGRGLDRAQLHAEDVVGTVGAGLMNLDGHEIVAVHQAVCREHQDLRQAFVRLVCGGRVVGHRKRHAQRADPDTVEIIYCAIVDIIRRYQTEVGQVSVPLKMCPVIDRDTAPGLIRRGDGGEKRVRILGRNGLETEKSATACPIGITERNLRPRGSLVDAGVVKFP